VAFLGRLSVPDIIQFEVNEVCDLSWKGFSYERKDLYWIE